MAKRKKAVVKRRRKASPAPVRRKRRRSMSEGPFSLAESFNISNPQSALRIAGEGALGAGIGSLVLKNVSDPKQKKLFLALLGVGCILMKKPSMAAGIAGVMAFDLLSENPSLSEREENVEFFDSEMLGEGEPLVLDQFGNPLALADGSPAPEAGSGYMPDYYASGYYANY